MWTESVILLVCIVTVNAVTCVDPISKWANCPICSCCSFPDRCPSETGMCRSDLGPNQDCSCVANSDGCYWGRFRTYHAQYNWNLAATAQEPTGPTIGQGPLPLPPSPPSPPPSPPVQVECITSTTSNRIKFCDCPSGAGGTMKSQQTVENPPSNTNTRRGREIFCRQACDGEGSRASDAGNVLIGNCKGTTNFCIYACIKSLGG